MIGRRTKRSAIAAFVGAASLVAFGCEPGCDDTLINETGTYRSVLVYQFSGVEPKKAFPHKRGKNLEMTIYRDLQQVAFKYVRDGKVVEETWSCVGRKVHDPNAPPLSGAATSTTNGGGDASAAGG